MKILKFRFSICAYGGKNVSLTFNKKTGFFDYIGDIFEQMSDIKDELELDSLLVSEFVEYVKLHCKHWEKSYWTSVCDGESWDLEIKTEDFHFKVDGHMDFPDNYEAVILKLTQMSGGKEF